MIREAIAKVAAGRDLTEEEMGAVMELIGEGRATQAEIGALIVGLNMKGESAAEITGAARVLRRRATPIPLIAGRGPLVDTCGTGGDGAATFNVSTTAAFVAAGAGLRVAKHGNRASSSRCGSADVLEALGVNLELSPRAVAECIEQVGIGFLFAPLLHPAMKHAVLPRREVGLKSIFNLLGPLANPAGADVQVLGVYRADLVEIMAEALRRLGARGAVVVYGEDGVDEISISGPTRIARLRNGEITVSRISPEDVGLPRAPRETVAGGDALVNADITLDVLKGRPGPRRDMVLLNAAAALFAAETVNDLKQGVLEAAEAIDSGRALAKLEALVETSERLALVREAVGGRP